MRNYFPHAITEDIRILDLSEPSKEDLSANGTESHGPMFKDNDKLFLFFRSIETENAKKIILNEYANEYSADITLLMALVSENQLNTLACVMERLLTDKEAYQMELLKKVEYYTAKMLTHEDTAFPVPEAAQRFLRLSDHGMRFAAGIVCEDCISNQTVQLMIFGYFFSLINQGLIKNFSNQIDS